MKRIRITIATALYIACLFSPAAAQAPKKVKMTIPVVAHSMTPVYLAQSKGFFADERLDLDITSTGGGGPDIRALIAGDVDFSFTTGDNVILAQQEGKRLVMVMSGLNKVFINWAMHKDAAKTKGITESTPLAEKIKSLKGLTVGVTNPGALTAHLAAFVIRKAGYTPSRTFRLYQWARARRGLPHWKIAKSMSLSPLRRFRRRRSAAAWPSCSSTMPEERTRRCRNS